MEMGQIQREPTLRPRNDPAHLGDLAFPVAGDWLDPNGESCVRRLNKEPLPERHSDVTWRLGGSIAQSDVGTPIYNVKDLKPGDLIFIPGDDGTPEAPGHVGMALGQGLLVEAPHTGLTVRIQPIAGYWEGQISKMRRIVQGP